MSLWTEVTIIVADPKNKNISDIVDKILKKYNYPETFFKSLYSKEKGVRIELRSTLDIDYILPILKDIKKEIKTFSYYTIKTYM